MDYVICSKVVERAKGGTKYARDLLFPFTCAHNANRVVKNIKILDQYNSIGDEIIRTWISLLTNSGYWKDVQCDEDPIFIKTCKILTDGILIVDEKEDYSDYEGVTAVDKDEAIEKTKPITKTINITQIGDGNQATSGDNSPNIVL